MKTIPVSASLSDSASAAGRGLSRRFDVSARYSALLTFRHSRRVLGTRQAYWLTLARYGWPGWQRPARAQLMLPALHALRVA